jgi:hypothetical protein
VTIALGALAVGEEPLRDDEMQIILGAGHGDIKQTPFFLDLGGRPGADVRGTSAMPSCLRITPGRDSFRSRPATRRLHGRSR